MTATCEACGLTIEAPDPIEGAAPPVCACGREETARGDDEPSYHDDLRDLIAQACDSVRSRELRAAIEVDAPLSVPEAIRLADELRLARPDVASPESAPARPQRGPALPRHRLGVALLPAIVIALAGVALLAGRASYRAAGELPAPRLPAMTDALAPLPALIEPFAPPLAPATCAEEPPPLDRAPSAPRPPPAAPAPPPASSSHPRTQPALSSRQRPASATGAPAPTVTAPPEPPSLMQAITDAVRNAPDRASSGPPPAARP